MSIPRHPWSSRCTRQTYCNPEAYKLQMISNPCHNCIFALSFLNRSTIYLYCEGSNRVYYHQQFLRLLLLIIKQLQAQLRKVLLYYMMRIAIMNVLSNDYFTYPLLRIYWSDPFSLRRTGGQTAEIRNN